MRYNLECLKQIMLLLEESLDISMTLERKCVDYKDLSSKMDAFSTPEIIQHLDILCENDLIKAFSQCGDGAVAEYLITEITAEGYKFIDDCRDKTTWEKFLKFANEHKGAALSFILERFFP